MARGFNTIGVFGDLNVGDGSTILADFTWNGDTTQEGTATQDTTNYIAGSIVTHNDRIWVARIDNDNFEPGSAMSQGATGGAIWQDLGDTSAVTAWSATEHYEEGNLVYDEMDDNRLYVATAAVGPSPTRPEADTANWEQVGGGPVAFRLQTARQVVPITASTAAAGDAQHYEMPSAEARATFYEALGIPPLTAGAAPVAFSTFNLNYRALLNQYVAGNDQSDEGVAPYRIDPATTIQLLANGTTFSLVNGLAASTTQGVANLGVVARFTGEDPTFQEGRNISVLFSRQLVDGDERTVFTVHADQPLLSQAADSPFIAFNADNSEISVRLDSQSLEADGAATNQALRVKVGDDSIVRTDDGIEVNLDDSDANNPNDLALVAGEGLRVRTVDLDTVPAGTDGADIVLRKDQVVTDRVSLRHATTGIPGSATAPASTLRITEDADTITFTGPAVAPWAQESSGGLIIPRSKLPNVELGNTHTFDSGGTSSLEVPGVVSVATSGAGSTVGNPAVLTVTALTRFYVGTDANGAGRVAVGAADYTNTNVEWAVDPNDATQFLVTITGDDATQATTDLAGINNTHTGVYLDQNNGPAMSLQAPAGEQIVTALVTAHVPGDPNMEGEIVAAAVANVGGQRDGDQAIAWHPGDLLVVAGDAPDDQNNGIYVYVGDDQGTTAVSPLTFPTGYTPPNNPTTMDIFAANFRAVVSVNTQVQTTVSTFEVDAQGDRSSTVLGSLNSVNYSEGGDVLEIVASGGILPIPQTQRRDDNDPAGGFINQIKIGGTIYRFGPTPPPPVFTLSSEGPLRLYRADAQSVDYDAMATQDLVNADGTTTEDSPATLSNLMFSADISGLNGTGTTIDAASGVVSVPAIGNTPSTDTLIVSTVTDGATLDALRGDDTTPVDFANDFTTPVAITRVTDGAQTISPTGGATFANVNMVWTREAAGGAVTIVFTGDATEISTLQNALAALSQNAVAETSYRFEIGAGPDTSATGDYVLSTADAAGIESTIPTTVDDSNIQRGTSSAVISVRGDIADVNIASISYETDASPSGIDPASVLTRTLQFTDQRQRPRTGFSGQGLSERTVNRTIFDTSAITFGLDLNNSDAVIRAGNGYDIDGFTVTPQGQAPVSFLGSQGDTNLPTSHTVTLDSAFFGAANTNASETRTVGFAFPMVAEPRFFQPTTPPQSETQRVQFYQPVGTLVQAATPDSAQIGTLNRLGGNSPVGTTGTTTFTTIVTGAVNDNIYILVPVAVLGNRTVTITNTLNGATLIAQRITGTTVANTAVSGVTANYVIIRGPEIAADGNTGQPVPANLTITIS